jgi:hypothetical protein
LSISGDYDHQYATVVNFAGMSNKDAKIREDVRYAEIPTISALDALIAVIACSRSRSRCGP